MIIIGLIQQWDSDQNQASNQRERERERERETCWSVKSEVEERGSSIGFCCVK